MKTNKKISNKIIRVALFLVIFLLSYPILSLDANAVAGKTTFRIIVENDDGEVMAGMPISCTLIKSNYGPDAPIDLINEVSDKIIEAKTNDFGEAVFEVDQSSEDTYKCAIEKLTTEDGCWYFPFPAVFLSAERTSNEPYYLIGIPSDETCKPGMSYDPEGLKELLPKGTPAPAKNEHSQTFVRTYQDNVEVEVNLDDTGNEAGSGGLGGFFRRIIEKILGLFGR